MTQGGKSKFAIWAIALGLLIVPMMEYPIASTNPFDGLMDLTWDNVPDLTITEARLRENPTDPEGLWPVTTTRGATIHRDLNDLPKPVREMRQRIIEAAKSGDIESLAPIFDAQPTQPLLGIDLNSEDPVTFLRETSNDGNGIETLAIIAELLEAPYATYNEGTRDAVYVWPYFVARDLEKLNPDELIELYTIVSHQDLKSMQDFGGWFYYRLTIASDGEWRSFVAGD